MERYAHLMAAQPSQLWFLVTLLVVIGPLILWHELGHAVAARAFSDGEVSVQVGRGDRWTFRLLDVDVTVGTPSPLGIGGFCRYRDDVTALGALAIALAGPLATFVAAVVALALLPSLHGPVHAFAAVVALESIWSLLVNLAPLTVTDRSGRRWRTDGWRALDALRHLSATPRPHRARVASPALAPHFVSARALASPACARCGHRRDEHVDLETGRPGGCLGQDYDFQSLSARRCSCAAFASVN